MLRAVETRMLRLLRPDDPWAQTAAKALSLGTRGGLLWYGMSVAMGTRRSWRRAAIHGVLGWGASSAAAFVVKALADRRRPSIPALGPDSHSSSMPSSHTAGAIGYATAVALAEPRLGVVVIPVSVAVGWARAATAQHFPSDVLAGASLGATIGGVTHRVGGRLLRAALAVR